MNFKTWSEIWLKDYAFITLKQKTRECYAAIINRINEKFGDFKLCDLTLSVLQSYVSELALTGNSKTGGGLASTTVNGIITVLQVVLKSAADAGFLSNYSADKIKRPKIKEKKISCFTLKEQKKIEKYALLSKNKSLAGIVICLYTGLRIGELLALTLDDIDLNAKILHVNKTCYYSSKGDAWGRITYEPKSTSSNRVIPIPKQLLPIFKDVKKNNFKFAVETKKGTPMSVRAYQASFKKLQKRLGINEKNFHALRHTFATRALECGMDVKTLSELLGHKNAAITLNRYVHSLTEHKREMMNRLGKFFF